MDPAARIASAFKVVAPIHRDDPLYAPPRKDQPSIGGIEKMGGGPDDYEATQYKKQINPETCLFPDVDSSQLLGSNRRSVIEDNQKGSDEADALKAIESSH